MKRLFFLSLLLSTILMYSACSKQTEVHGKVLTPHGVPVANAEVKIDKVTNSAAYPESTTFSGTTDAEGTYKISFKAKNKSSYYVKCTSDSGYKREYITNKGGSNPIDLTLE